MAKSIEIRDLVADVRERVDILDVARDIVPSGLRRIGDSYTARCPFCGDGDAKDGKFMVSGKKSGRELNFFTCFKCLEKGDHISLYARTQRVNYVQAAIELARNYGVISASEYAELTKRKVRTDVVRKIEDECKKIDLKKMESMSKKASDRVLNYVYSLFIRESGLSDEHMEFLIDKRGYTEEEVRSGRFFTFPTKAVLKKMEKSISETDLSRILFGVLSDDEIRNINKNPLDILKYVPGFYFTAKSWMSDDGKFRTKKEGNWRDAEGSERGNWSFIGYKNAIGFPLTNAYGSIVGIQIRLHDEDAKRIGGKYRFFSSSRFISELATHESKEIWGASPGSPIDVTIPNRIKTSCFAITEGKFKADKLSNATGMITFSVQGVGSWRHIGKSIKEVEDHPNLLSNFNERKKIVYIAFDADMKYKYEVFVQGVKMSDSLAKDGYEIKYLLWDDEYKGIDDALIALGKEAIKPENKDIWEAKYHAIVKLLKLRLNVADTKNPTEEQMLMFKPYFNLPLTKIEESISKEVKRLKEGRSQ